MSQILLLPLLVYGAVFLLAIPIGLYMARVFEGRLGLPAWLRRLESLLDTGPQNWKQYAFSFMAFNVLTFVVGFAVLALQPYLPLNPDGKKMLAVSPGRRDRTNRPMACAKYSGVEALVA